MSVPYRSGTPIYNLKVKTGSEACTHEPPRALQYRTLPPSHGGFPSCHMSSGFGSYLPDKKGSGATTCTVALDPLGRLRCTACPMALDPASLQGGLRATTRPTVPCGPRASNIKKRLVCLPVQLGSHVPNATHMFPRCQTSGPSWDCKTCW
jgi:hypothetical protein